jgi:hypothetical protein
MRWRRTAVIVPGIGVSLLPKLMCPLCWPAYAGLLSTLGLGFLVNSRNLLVVTAIFLVIAVSTLALRARERRGYGPAVTGLAATVAVLFGKFYLESPRTMYVAVGILIAASIWNSWPVQPSASCAGCVDRGPQALREKSL